MMHTELKAIIANEISVAAHLVDILYDEQRALTHDDVESLYQVLDQKQHAIASLESLCSQREQRQSASSGQGDAAAELGTQWEELCQLIRRCHDLNLVNGRIVAVSRNRTSQALSIVKGGTDANDTYSAKGEASAPQSRHAITRV